MTMEALPGDLQPAVINVRDQLDEEILYNKKRNADDFVSLDNSSSSNKLLENLNRLRKNKQFCDVILQVSSKVDFHEVHCHRAVVASVSPYLFELFDQRLKSGTADRALTDQCTLPGEFDMDVFESLIEYAYTAKLDLPRQKLRSAYLTAAKLRITPIVQFCGSQLVSSLTPENCLGIRAVLLQASASCLQPDQISLISKLDSFIKHNINEVLKSSELSGLRHIQMELIQSTLVEIESTNERHLFKMLLDWLRVGWARDGELNMDRLTEKVHMLYLNRDRTLHDCVDIESGDARDSELVQDYKRLSKRLNQAQGGEKVGYAQAEVPAVSASGDRVMLGLNNSHNSGKTRDSFKMRNGHGNASNNVPTKPKQFLFTRSDSSSSSDEEEYDCNFRVVATAPTGVHSTMGLAIVQSEMVLLSVVRRLNNNINNNSNNQSTGSNSQSDHGGSPSNEWSPDHTASSPNSPQNSSNGHPVLEHTGLSSNGQTTPPVTAGNTNNNGGGGPPMGQLPGSIGGSNQMSPQKLYQQLQQMSTLAAMNHQRCSMGVAELNGSLFVCGGYDRGECLRSVELLSLSKNRWTPLPDMLVPRARTNVASLNGLVYAMGGSDGSRDLASAEVYHSDRQRWEALPPLPVPRSHAGVCALNGKIYVIGGWTGAGQDGMTRVDVFDPKTASWDTIAGLNIGRSQAGVAVMNGCIYVLGGCEAWNCTPSVERYSPEEDRWILCAPMQSARRGCGAAALNSRLYAIGGHDSSRSLCSVEIYDAATNTWTPGPALTTCRANVGAAVVRGRLLAVGGFNGKTFLNTLETLDCTPVDDDGEPEWTVFVDRQTWLLDNTSHDQSIRQRSEENLQETPDESSRDGVIALTQVAAATDNAAAPQHYNQVNDEDEDDDEIDSHKEIDESDETKNGTLNASNRDSRESSSGISGC
ncbi:influenza virus NS1A-binding protein homolog A-like isoform X3 [Varroa jacobsoni]|uniref:BTB domain-containing protein n=1 Tax=Varroa destructor TaxID=109461 RepID=A0A7M7K6B3_VARDE|nr:influenza virus NS1A-binding protein homolog A-like isoform X2 [Varroa destructor]XP_022661872.1 influenza virus NS1A-binding protein homolog A-like isoform X2 [Varroa destructor]XP_022661873.1 influenza virus NS1A-binding protein homolog A-like isoform X2 [Varroa destructor]XP_022709204.1 influenza virus NS1A-binding protein homolog A-like isoform X3 [Varroa jacobsoni]XP_022709205.1 influenza virus NS1A-binding protein homolog A-like isoform X3 [Varroa jacobsoni]XP_022709207.1 influenza vi